MQKEYREPTDFLRFDFVYEKIKGNDEEFEFGARANETIYYNFLKNLTSLRNLN